VSNAHLQVFVKNVILVITSLHLDALLNAHLAGMLKMVSVFLVQATAPNVKLAIPVILASLDTHYMKVNALMHAQLVILAKMENAKIAPKTVALAQMPSIAQDA